MPKQSKLVVNPLEEAHYEKLEYLKRSLAESRDYFLALQDCKCDVQVLLDENKEQMQIVETILKRFGREKVKR